MANHNGNPNQGGNQKPPESVIYNTAGLRPIKATFQLDMDQLKNEIRKIAEREIGGIQDITFERDASTGAVRGYLWFDANGEHFVDNSAAGTALPHGGKISRMSSKFKEFATKYGWTSFDEDPEHGNDRVHLNAVVNRNQNRESRNKLMFLQISMNPFLFAIFDMFGEGFKKTYNQGTPKFCMRREWRWRKGETGKYHTLVGITVEKYVADAYALSDRPRASKSGRFN